MGLNTKSKHKYYLWYALGRVPAATCLCLYSSGGRSQAKEAQKKKGYRSGWYGCNWRVRKMVLHWGCWDDVKGVGILEG